MPAVLSQGGHELVVHTVATGVRRCSIPFSAQPKLVKQLDDARFVVWLNPFWGPVADDGKTFEQMKIYQDIKKRIETSVNLPALTDELLPRDIRGDVRRGGSLSLEILFHVASRTAKLSGKCFGRLSMEVRQVTMVRLFGPSFGQSITNHSFSSRSCCWRRIDSSFLSCIPQRLRVFASEVRFY